MAGCSQKWRNNMEILEKKLAKTAIYTIKGSLDPNTSDTLMEKVNVNGITEVKKVKLTN